MLKSIDDFLNETTMYRLLIYYLGGLLGIAFVVSLFGNLGFSPVALLVSSAILLAACWGINRVFAYVFNVPMNHESSIITALILALLITPKLGQYDLLFLLAASGLAMASKYVLTIRDVHIFNPAAIAVVLTAIRATPRCKLVGRHGYHATIRFSRWPLTSTQDQARSNGNWFSVINIHRNSSLYHTEPR